MFKRLFRIKSKDRYAILWWPNTDLNPEVSGPYDNHRECREARDKIRAQQRREEKMAQAIVMNRGFSR